MLRLRHEDHDAIQLLAHPELTSQARVIAGAIGELQHFAFGGRGGSHRGKPVGMNMNVTGAARGTAAAIAIDPWHAVPDSADHQRLAFSELDGVAGAVVSEVGDSSHGSAMP